MHTLRRLSQDGVAASFVRRRCTTRTAASGTANHFRAYQHQHRNNHVFRRPYFSSDSAVSSIQTTHHQDESNHSERLDRNSLLLDSQIKNHTSWWQPNTTHVQMREFSTTTFTTTTSSGVPKDDSTNNYQHEKVISDGKQQIQAHALQGEAEQAQEILEQLETILFASARTDQEKADAETSLLECRQAVLDAWITHQTLLVNELKQSEQLMANPTKQQIQEIFQAAEYAHQALEKTVPFLSRPALSIYTQTPKQRSNDPDNLEDDGMSLGKTTTKTPAPAKNAQATLHRINAVLTAWARVSRLSQGKYHRGIPQRATFLLQRMEASTTVKPTIESYNAVLEAWACSKEHLRGTMAEQLFQRMMKKKGVTANGESFCLIIEAWCRSKQKKSAFAATGHLMKLLKRLENGREDTTEPSLELYHMVMESWTHAE